MRAPRWIRVLLTLLFGAVLVGVGAGPAFADTQPDPDAPTVVALDAAGAGVDDFEFTSFDALYDLSRSGDGRSQLRTVETLVALFPDFDQNRGIQRALVQDYKGHGTSIDIVQVTDENGVPRSYESNVDDDGFLVLTIAVPEGQFVHGEQTYVIEYTQKDVTATSTDLVDDVTRDEFFWDTNGTGWDQPFAEVNATLRVDSDLRSALTGEAYCYYGFESSTDRCTIDSLGDGEFSASVSDLYGGQNMSIVVSFEPGTFAGAPFWTYVPILALLAIALTIFALVYLLVVRFVFWRDAPGRGTIIAQYEAPEGLGMLVAANIVGKPNKGMAAAIVDLAVQKNLRILEHDQGWSKVFGVQKLSSQGLMPDEQRVMGALFSMNPYSLGRILPGLQNLFSIGGATPQPLAEPEGEVRWLTKGDRSLGVQVLGLTKAVEKEVEAGGLRRSPSMRPTAIALVAYVLAGILLIIQSVTGGGGETSITISVLGLNILPWVAILSLFILGRRKPLTQKGSELREHLEGLREFIRVAEADRLQMLQSVSGAERVTTSDGAAIIKIYEKLLPYAVIFGLEKEWATEIAKYYDTSTPPDWYSGTNGFAIGAFAAGIGSLSSSVSTSYSSSGGSSSSGGGGGGGSSGGGGGGGGGGGV